MYVLPYGQMSLWGATVITSLMSAIPWVGQDIVESTNIIEYYSSTIYTTCLLLPTIGTVSTYAFKKGNNNIRLDKKNIFVCVRSSTLIFYSFLTGLIDGDGYIEITRTKKGFITIKLVIWIHLEDISTLEYVHSVLKLGKISINRDHKSPNCKLIINRTDLQ